MPREFFYEFTDTVGVAVCVGGVERSRGEFHGRVGNLSVLSVVFVSDILLIVE